jgi:hypothetical protein
MIPRPEKIHPSLSLTTIAAAPIRRVTRGVTTIVGALAGARRQK